MNTTYDFVYTAFLEYADNSPTRLASHIRSQARSLTESVLEIMDEDPSAEYDPEELVFSHVESLK